MVNVKIGGVFVQTSDTRTPISSLSGYLRLSLSLGHRMDAASMRKRDVRNCRWVGYGLVKGVTHPGKRISVISRPEAMKVGLHGELVQGFEGIAVDPSPLCYELSAPHGFGGFVRWVYFADPQGAQDFLGLDWSIIAPRLLGVVNTMLSVEAVVKVLALHGVTLSAEVVLLNWRMCEELRDKKWRRMYRLVTVAGWMERAAQLFAPGSSHCPRCGLKTLRPEDSFCSYCGCRPEIVRQHALQGV